VRSATPGKVEGSVLYLAEFSFELIVDDPLACATCAEMLHCPGETGDTLSNTDPDSRAQLK
jgi:hypothetical protein